MSSKRIHFLPDSTYSRGFYNYLLKHSNLHHVFYIMSTSNSSNYFSDISSSDMVIYNCSTIYSKFKILFILKFFEKDDLIYFHYFFWFSFLIFIFYFRTNTIYWLLWGGEVHHFNAFSVLPETRRKFKFPAMSQVYYWLYSFLLRFCISRFNYIFCFSNLEYDTLPFRPGLNTHYLKFIYPMDFNFPDVLVQTNQSKVFLGNSGSLYNNHLDVFKRLILLNDLTEIKCPLSYGDPGYIKKIISAGNTFFQSSFIPITRFYDKSAYISEINSSSYVILGHLVQQGTGLLRLAILLKKTVYVYKNSFHAKFLNSIGVEFRTIESLSDSPLSMLSQNILRKNRLLLLDYFSSENIFDGFKQLNLID